MQALWMYSAPVHVVLCARLTTVVSWARWWIDYGVHGDTYVSVVEFGSTTNAASIMTFGESADPKSKHFFDQAPLYVKGQFKPSWMTLEEVKQHSESAYHPGEEANH
jgi:acyl-homoserine lactone acylase PvdQ